MGLFLWGCNLSHILAHINPKPSLTKPQLYCCHTKARCDVIFYVLGPWICGWGIELSNDFCIKSIIQFVTTKDPIPINEFIIQLNPSHLSQHHHNEPLPTQCYPKGIIIPGRNDREMNERRKYVMNVEKCWKKWFHDVLCWKIQYNWIDYKAAKIVTNTSAGGEFWVGIVGVGEMKGGWRGSAEMWRGVCVCFNHFDFDCWNWLKLVNVEIKATNNHHPHSAYPIQTSWQKRWECVCGVGCGVHW